MNAQEHPRTAAEERGRFFEGQLMHLVVLLALVGGVAWLARLEPFLEGEFLGLRTTTWVLLAVADAVAHQVFVWLCWRAELAGRGLTRTMGRSGYRLYAAVFTLLIVLRPLLAFAVGWSNRGSLPMVEGMGISVTILLLGPGLYLMYSVIRFFGLQRALGIDHFDPAWRSRPMERRGIFRWTPNAMYVFGFLVLWIPGFLFESFAALVVAGFSHLYIWVHWFCTEKPDMRRIYGTLRL